MSGPIGSLESADRQDALMCRIDCGERGSCPDPGALASFVDGMAPEADKDAIARHLAACADCRQAAADACGFGDAAPRPRWRLRARAAARALSRSGALAAAALLAFVAGSASTWWMGERELSAGPMAADLARLTPSSGSAEQGPLSVTRGITLTPTQQAALAALRERDAAASAALQDRLDQIAQDLERELSAEGPDRMRIGTLLQERFEVTGDRLRLEAAQVRDFCMLLTPEQCARLARSRGMWHGTRGRSGSSHAHTLPSP